MSGNDVQRRVRCARITRAASIAVAAVLAVMATFVAARSLAGAAAMAFPVAVLLIIAALETSGLRQWRAEERTRELNRHAGRLEIAAKMVREGTVPGMTATADLELGFARLNATLGSCVHPDAEPVDLLLTGERVAWICADCNADLPAGWTPAGQPSSPAVCECPDETRDTVWVRVPGSATPVASYCAACGRGAGTLTATGSGMLSGTAALSGSGTLSANAIWDDVAYASEASRHFAQLARVGREYCLSYCPICAERLDALMRASVLGPLIESVRQELEAQRWLDKERWGGNE